MQPNVANNLQLRDIHLPDANLAWPPAIGWWFVLVVICLVLIAIYFSVRYWRQQTVKKMALARFKQIKERYEVDDDSTLLAQQLNTLLRQIVLHYYPREQAANSQGETYIKQLRDINQKQVLFENHLQQLAQASYQKNHAFDAGKLLQDIELWIKGLNRRLSA